MPPAVNHANGSNDDANVKRSRQSVDGLKGIAVCAVYFNKLYFPPLFFFFQKKKKKKKKRSRFEKNEATRRIFTRCSLFSLSPKGLRLSMFNTVVRTRK
ncbi:hypothetical protein PUN28_001988 [Cardiocondyla obscurior]|uniref:Uncharacterized protein n=1 Tax=Cardiocondyla obscurior TaxID=286306 RepID=A0AAW2GS37_9HYME